MTEPAFSPAEDRIYREACEDLKALLAFMKERKHAGQAVVRVSIDTQWLVRSKAVKIE